MQLPSLVPRAQAFDFIRNLYASVGFDTSNMTVAGFIQPILNVFYGIAAVILLINLVRSGLQMSIHGQKGLEEAKKSIRNSIIGLAVVMFAVIITNVLAGLFGID